MFEGVQIAIGIAAAIGFFFLGIGLVIGGWVGKAKRVARCGVALSLLGPVTGALIWLFVQQIDRDHRKESEAREEVAKTSPAVTRLRWIEHADVIADFRENVKQKHDTRFVTVYGLSFGAEFEGLEDTPEIHQLIKEHGSRSLESGSDVFGSSLEMELTHRITEYARRYNSLLLGYLEREK